MLGVVILSKSKVFGYARVSSKDQNLDRQIQQLLEYGINEDCIFADKCSGKDFDRFEYKTLLNRLRDEDLVVICSIDWVETIRKSFNSGIISRILFKPT